jgi:hypothetical protein
VSASDLRVVDLIAALIDDNDLAIAVSGNIDSNLVSNVFGHILGLCIVDAFETYRVLEPETVDDLEMIFWHSVSFVLRDRKSASVGDVPESDIERGGLCPERNGGTCIASSQEKITMPAFVEVIVQKIAEAAPN